MSPYINFSNLETTRKGEIGEQLVDSIIASTGAQLYRSLNTNCSHYIDRFFITTAGLTFSADAKAKAARSAYPDTGIDLKHFNKYKEINEHTPFLLYFVDEFINTFYGNYLNKLLESKEIFINWLPGLIEYPRYETDQYCQKIYFPLENMVKFGKIDDITSDKLRELSGGRNYHYPKYRYPDWLY